MRYRSARTVPAREAGDVGEPVERDVQAPQRGEMLEEIEVLACIMGFIDLLGCEQYACGLPASLDSGGDLVIGI